MMTKTMKKALGAVAIAIATAAFAAPSFAADVTVKELNKGPDGFFAFSPDFVKSILATASTSSPRTRATTCSRSRA